MTRALVWIGLVCVAFGLGSYRVLGEFNAFNASNLALGAACLGAGLLRGLRRIGQSAAHTQGGGNVGRSFAQLVAVIAVSVAAVQLTAASDLRFDWTFEGRFALSPATTQAVASLPAPLEMTLYFLPGDPRIRNTGLLLDELARHGDVQVSRRNLNEFPEDEDRFGIGSSNSVVLQTAGRWELVSRPTEGGLFEALRYLDDPQGRDVLYVAVGAGEGDLEREDERGFSGLRSALELEGYEVRPLPTAAIDAIPEDAAAVVAIAPERPMRETAVEALVDYLNHGGTLVAFLEPGRTGNLEEILGRFGIHSPDAVLVDPDSGPIDGDLAGLNPIAHHYGDHPVTRGLDKNRQTFFRRARSFHLYKEEPADKLRMVVYASRRSWLDEDLGILRSLETPVRPAESRTDYHPLVVTARLQREAGETRVVAFGDSDLASNRYLRTLYNLDLVLNAIHWSVRREPDITLRPKVTELIQFPVPLQQSLQALYGVGLLVPEVLLVMAGLMWLRNRSA